MLVVKKDTKDTEVEKPSKLCSFRDLNIDNIVPFVPRQCKLDNAPPNVSVISHAGTSGRPLTPPGAKVTSSGNQHYEVLPIVNVQAVGCDGNPMQLKTLLDTGSTTSFVSVSASNKILRLGETDEIHVDINTLGGTNSFPLKQINFKLYHPNKHLRKRLNITALVTGHIVSSPACDEHPEPVVRDRLRKINLNEGFPRLGSPIDLLLGVGDLFKIVKGVKERLTETFCVLDTIYGLVACGSHSPTTKLSYARPITMVTNLERLNANIERMLKAEELPLDNILGTLTRDEVLAVQKIEESLKRDPNTGTYSTGLLWRSEPQVRNNFRQAKARFETLLRRLKRDPVRCDAYKKAMQDFFDIKVVEEVSWEDQEKIEDLSRDDCFFLSHREVYLPTRQTTKCRVVFDGSAKTSTGKSLNDCLLAGPALQQNLVAIELRFRMKKVGLVGDCAKMFLQIGMKKEDRDFLRFLWKDPTDSKAEPKTYRFTTMVFGTTDAPFQAISTLQRLARETLDKKNVTPMETRLCSVIKNDTYVDDITTGGEDEEEAFSVYQGLTTLLGSAGFKIRKWATNSTDLLKKIPPEERSATKEIIERSNPVTASEDISSLGVRWNPETDQIVYDCYQDLHLKNDDTKTSVASLLATPFDPLGGLAPFILLARKVMKETHIAGMGWKDKLPEPLIPEWHNWVEMTKKLDLVKYPRYVPHNEDSEIHIFGDASATMGYGIVVYVRTEVGRGKFVSNFLYAKSKINPKKEVTVPRLELMAALLCVETGQFIQRELGVKAEKIFCWSDPEITLWWIKKKPDLLVPFVANRVEKIQHSQYPFSYINTKDNSADIASRGCTPEELMMDQWIKGPWFLQEAKEKWPSYEIDYSKVDPFEGLKRQHVFVYTTLSYCRGNNESIVEMHSYFSDYDSLLRKTASVILCKDIWVAKHRGVSVPEFNLFEVMVRLPQARIFWIKDAQRKYFAAEVFRLQQGKSVHSESKLLAFNPFLDKQGIMRSHGRLMESSLPDRMKKPIILPKHHGFTRTLVKKVHEENHHAPINWCHFHLRQTYWILQSRQLIKKIIRRCFECQKANARRGYQIMGLLPKDRVEPEPPFSRIGVDYTSQLNIKPAYHSNKIIPAFLVVFTCFVTRAVHLEVVLTEKAEGFLMAFKRMANTRGYPQHVYSDHGSNLMKADKLLSKTVAKNNESLKEASEKFHFQWHYSTELHSESGGVWERCVKMAKVPLRKALGDTLLTYVELQTLCKEIEGQLNDRPLIEASEETPEVLTPSLLCLGRKIKPRVDHFDETQYEEISDLRVRWKLKKKLLENFRRSWIEEYLVQLQNRHKWFTKRPNIKENDLVLVEKEHIKRSDWPIARVDKLLMGRDGVVRSARIVTKDLATKKRKGKPNYIVRSVRELYPLEETPLDRAIPVLTELDPSTPQGIFLDNFVEKPDVSEKQSTV